MTAKFIDPDDQNATRKVFEVWLSLVNLLPFLFYPTLFLFSYKTDIYVRLLLIVWVKQSSN